MVEFLLDENILGLGRYLDGIKYKKIGDEGCPPKESDDILVVKYAKEHDLIIVTNDEKMIKQCDMLQIECIKPDIPDIEKQLYEKIKARAESG